MVGHKSEINRFLTAGPSKCSCNDVIKPRN